MSLNVDTYGSGTILRPQVAGYHTVCYESLLQLLSYLEEHDRDLRDHSERVCSLCLQVARYLGFSSRDLFHLQVAALLHDIGKLHIPTHILSKPGNLTCQEFLAVQHHAVNGEQMLHEYFMPEMVCLAVRAHHERFDGMGYPDGLAGRKIPMVARILKVVDSFDAMTADRPYREAMNSEDVSQWIMTMAGIYFDPVVVNAFMTMVTC